MTHGSAQTRGLVTDEALPSGEVLVKVPRKLWLVEENFPELTMAFPEHGECILMRKEDMVLAAAFALEAKKGKASFYAPHFRMLPTLQDFNVFHPFLADLSLIKDFGELPILKVLRVANDEWFRQVKACFEAWQHMPKSLVAGLSWDAMMTSLYQLSTRTFSSTGVSTIVSTSSANAATTKGSLSMSVPIADLVNTAPAARANADWSVQEDAFELKSLTAIPAGGEILEQYCHMCDNEKMLTTWGVYFEDNPVRLNAVEPIDCNEVGVAGYLRNATTAMLDLDGAAAALEAGWTAPRCSPAALAAAGTRGPLRCSLARLAWERCAGVWEHTAWRGRGGESLDIATEQHWTAWNVLGDVLRSRKDLAGAATSYQAAIRVKPLHAESHNKLGVILRDQGDLPGARASYKTALGIDPKHASAHAHLGDLSWNAGDLAGAKNSYRATLRLNPRNAQVHNDLGTILRNENKLKDAGKHFRVALRINPRHIHAHNNLATILQMQSDGSGAEKSYQAALHLNPKLADVHFNLGTLFHGQGNMLGALNSYRTALQLDPQHTQARNELIAMQK